MLYQNCFKYFPNVLSLHQIIDCHKVQFDSKYLCNMALLKTKQRSINTQSRMAFSSRGALEKFKTTGVPLKTVTAPSWALIWTLTKTYFTISWSCWAYNRTGGVWCKPVSWMACKIGFLFTSEFNVILLNWSPVSCTANSQLCKSWWSSKWVGQAPCTSLSISYLLPARNAPNCCWTVRQPWL